ncbi:MAG: aldose epimerase family protein [Pseudomonadota bacterium]
MELFGTTAAGEDVHAIDLVGDAISARVLTYGAVLNDVRMAGLGYPLTLGSPDLAAYEGPLESFGSLIGPFANRIKGAEAVIAGQSYQFEKNFEGAHTLHSGAMGTHRQVWEVIDLSASHVVLALALPDGLGGFPGNRTVVATYRVEGASITLTVEARSDAPTLLSFANHSYWALDGAAAFGGHVLTIPADEVLEMGPALMPTGRVLSLDGSDYDARGGLALTGDAQQFFDINYCLGTLDIPLREVARLRGTSGVELVMESTAPGLQVYDCGTIDGAGFETHHGAAYGAYSGLALEAQLWPGAAHHGAFPSAEGVAFDQTTRWSFSA